MNIVAAVAVVLPALAGLLVARTVLSGRQQRRALVAGVALATSVGAAIIGLDVAAPGAALASGELPRLGTLDVPAINQAAVVVVSGAFDPQQQGAASGDYVIDVDADGETLPPIAGRFEQHLESRRMGRRGHAQVVVAQMERGHGLPAQAQGHPLHLKLSTESGALVGPLHILVRPADPPMIIVAGAAALLLLLQLVLQRGIPRKSAFPAVFIVIAGTIYALMLENGAHPPTFVGVFVIAIAAALVGALTSAMVTLLPLFTNPGGQARPA